MNKTLGDIEQRYITVQELVDQAAMLRDSKMLSKLSLHPPTEHAKFPVFVLPLPENSQFRGRDEILQRMHDHLRPQNRGHKLHCFTLYGLGGVGKTQTVAAYAYKYGSRFRYVAEYDAVFWINSENEAALRQRFLEVALALKRPGVTGGTDSQTVRREVQAWLTETGMYRTYYSDQICFVSSPINVHKLRQASNGCSSTITWTIGTPF